MGSESWKASDCRRRCSVMRRWRAFCGRGLDLVHARLSPVLRQTRSQYFQRAVVPELLLRIRTLLSREDSCWSVQFHDPKNDPFVFVASLFKLKNDPFVFVVSLFCSFVTFSIRSITLKYSSSRGDQWWWGHPFHSSCQLVGCKVKLLQTSANVRRERGLEIIPGRLLDKHK